MQNLLDKFRRWLHYYLYEETDDPNVPGKLRVKRVLHNIVLIEVWAASTIVVGLPLSVFIFLLLFSVPYAFFYYCAVMTSLSLIFYFGRRHEKMKEEDYEKTLRSGADSYTEALTH